MGPVLNLGIVAPGFPPDAGGVETVVGHLARELAGRGHHVEVVAHGRYGDRRHRTVDPESGLVVHRFPDRTGSRRFEVSPGLWRHLHRARGTLDVVHAHNFHASAALATVMDRRTPLVLSPHYHGGGHTPAARAVHLLYAPAGARLLDRAARLVCVSDAEADRLAAHHPRSADKIVVIPNGVDVRAIVEAEPYPVRGQVVLVAGRLEEYKGVGVALEAMARLRASDVRMVVLGTGPQAEPLRAQAHRLGLGRTVSFLGHVPHDELRRWQRTASVTLALSRHEAFGLGVLEAGVAGSAVVASAISAHREVVERWSVPAQLVDAPATPAVVAEALASALADHTPRDVGAVTAPTWDDVARQVERVLHEATGHTVTDPVSPAPPDVLLHSMSPLHGRQYTGDH